MKIIDIKTFVLQVPVTGGEIGDSRYRVTHWGAAGVTVHTDEGVTGYGYTGVLAHQPVIHRMLAECREHLFGPMLVGEDPLESQYLWRKLAQSPPVRGAGMSGVARQSLAALDIALWDIKAKVAGLPLWKLLGGSATDRVEAYNTDVGWLTQTRQQLVDDCRRAVEVEGFRGIKPKVGSPNPHDDLQRIEAVRDAVGPYVKLMVDANSQWDLPTAIRLSHRLKDFDVYWMEEPLAADDVTGHAALARSGPTPIALGEQLTKLDEFSRFIRADAVHYVQADAVRLAGITEWWQTADLALGCRLPVVAHVADMMQMHLHLSIAHPACRLLEYIPWARDCFEEPATVKDGLFVAPETPGAGTTLKPDALEKYGVG